MKKKSIMKRLAAVVLTVTMALSWTVGDVFATDYSSYSNDRVGWGLVYTTDHSTPGGSFPKGVDITEYDAYYVGDTSDKVIYLTFDCGYDNGYTTGVLDYLKKKGIKAAFFVTKDFVDKQPDLVRRMRDEGHIIGNHTVRHKDMTTLSVSDAKNELIQVAAAVKEVTGTKIDPYFRPPEGAYSVRTLKLYQDMGYKTVFWSFAARDWDVNNQPGADTVYNSFMQRYCNGSIPLLHIISSSSTGAVKPIVEAMEEKGYRFGTLNELGKPDGEVTVNIDTTIEYTGHAVKPTVTTTNEGANVTYSYYEKIDGKYTKISAAPKLPGLYYVTAIVDATDSYGLAKSEVVHFHITRGTGSLVLTVPDKKYDGEKPVPSVKKKGDYEKVYCRYYDADGNRLSAAPTEPGVYYAQAYAYKTKLYKKCVSEKVSFEIFA